MLKFLLALALFTALLFARENPFQPVFDHNQFPVSTNTPEVLKPLKHEQFTLPSTARSVTRIIIEYKNLDGSIEQKSKELNKAIDWHVPITVTHHFKKSKRKSFIKRADIGFITFYTKGSVMKLKTRHKILRHFMMANPHRIVLDFQGSLHFLAKKFTHFDAPFYRVRIGNHEGYYRVVVELDGQYEYKIQKKSKAYELIIK